MNILLFRNFSKRRNSTKQPNDADGISVNVYLKDRCAYITPSFFLANGEAFVYLKAWGNYYFIDGVEWDINGASYIKCTIDVLASFKSDILTTSAFIKYSSSNFDVNVIDERVTQNITSRYDIIDYDYSEIPLFYESGCFILCCTNDTYGLTIYAMNNNTLQALIHDISNLGATAIGELVLRFGSLWNSIQSLRWIPILLSDLPIAQHDVNVEIGGLNFEVQADKLVTQPSITRSQAITIPWYYNDFRRYNGFTNIFLTLPFVGKVELDTMELIGINDLQVLYNINPITGSSIVIVQKAEELGEGKKVIATFSATLGRPIPISATSVDAEGALAGAATMVAAGTGMFAGMATETLTEEAFLKQAKDMVNGELKGVVAGLNKSTNTVGTYGGTYYEHILSAPIIEVISRVSRTEPSELTTLYGRPCCKVLQISTLSGYVETKGFRIDISAQSQIKAMIDNLMDSGVYLE